MKNTVRKLLIDRFVDSAKEFKNLRSLITAALLIALHTVLCFVSIQVTESLRISISFIANVVIGCLFGPVMGFVCGGVGDIIQYMIKPTGPYFYGWTLSAALAGFIYGMFFYGKYPIYKEKKDEDKNVSIKEKVLNLTGLLIPLITLIIWYAFPFLKITTKSGEDTMTGNGLSYMIALIMDKKVNCAVIVSMMVFVVCIVLCVFYIFKLHTVSLIVSVIFTFTSILAVYTDRKTVSTLMGYNVIIVLMIAYIFIQLALLAEKYSLDFLFLIRCTTGIGLDMILVNVILGTYWVTVMYGKGFTFYFTVRFVKNIIQMPVNIIITYYVLSFIRKNLKKKNNL